MSTEKESYKTGNNPDYQQQKSSTEEEIRDNTLLHHLNYLTCTCQKIWSPLTSLWVPSVCLLSQRSPTDNTEMP